jgi:hypothetical protein
MKTTIRDKEVPEDRLRREANEVEETDADSVAGCMDPRIGVDS